ncbi:iron-siderophore ABC transporter substrate-binding protein [Nakamurella sp. DB0629]|uniref:Iron-siderophore ABC transporter substrate-binding protein n=1 Tax=Nakamurella aerolata TaxID=1656892 RepID=A0A849A9X3_9ACTN|nr:iron-siderophore ABC transporter substrate-binding protein [Nakamurella aerolata]
MAPDSAAAAESSNPASSNPESSNPASSNPESSAPASTAAADSAAAAGSAAPAGSGATTSAAAAAWTPVTIDHAFGSTTIKTKPERVATVAYANQEVPLALGVVPVGMARADWGDDDKDGVLPWVDAKLKELGGQRPVLFDETDGIDFEAVAKTKPDLILATYSGLTKQDYQTLSAIAPVVAYPKVAWGTPWREMIAMGSKALGMPAEGAALTKRLEQRIADGVAKYPQLKGKSAMFLTHVDPKDLSQVSFYSAKDTRVMFFDDLGMMSPPGIVAASKASDKYSITQSVEQADNFADVDVIVTFGGKELMDALNGDPLLSQIPAVANKAIVNLPGDQPIGNASNPMPLSIDYTLDEYLGLLAAAVDKQA